MKNENIRNEISSKITILSFFMTCAMVCYHCKGLGSAQAMGFFDSKVNSSIESLFDQMGYIVMCYFFTVTGYLLFSNYRTKDYPAKINRRLRSLLIPYILWQCIAVLIDILQKQYTFSLPDFLSRTVGLAQWPQNGALWYVYAIFLLALFSPILHLLFKNKRVALLSVIFITVLIEGIDYLSHPYITDFFGHGIMANILRSIVKFLNYGVIPNILYYLPCYLLGCYCGRFMDEIPTKETLLCIFTVLFISLALNGTFPGFFFETALKSLPLLGLLALPVIPSLQGKKIYGLSFLIYAIHQPLIADLRERIYTGLLMPLTVPVSMQSILIRAFILAITIALAACIYLILNRYSPKLLRIITGGRT